MTKKTDQTLSRVMLRFPADIKPRITKLLGAVRKDPKFHSIFVSEADVLRMCLENGLDFLLNEYFPKYSEHDR